MQHESVETEYIDVSGTRIAYRCFGADTLVVTGLRDIVLPAVNSFILADKIPNAHLIAYPDSGHGAYAQYHDLFVKQTNLFLDALAD